MIKGFSLKAKEKKEEGSSPGSASPTSNVALLRIQKDISDLSLPPSITVSFPDKNDLMNFEVAIIPDEGFYKGGKFCFSFKIKSLYPHEPPKVLALQRIFHPNIDFNGNVCLNILREDWKPVLSLSAILFGLQFLFQEPNTEDPLNKQAAQLLQSDRMAFQRVVSSTMNGHLHDGIKFDNVMLLPKAQKQSYRR